MVLPDNKHVSSKTDHREDTYGGALMWLQGRSWTISAYGWHRFPKCAKDEADAVFLVSRSCTAVSVILHSTRCRESYI